MELHFGYNCKHFLPALGKCRTLIDERRTRKELVEPKWLTTRELLIYLNLSQRELLRQIASGEIKTKLQKDGKVTFGVSAAWHYDDCFLASGGGQCLYFEAHRGKTISCLAELEGLEAEHTNCTSAPSRSDVKIFEDGVLKIIGTPAETGASTE